MGQNLVNNFWERWQKANELERESIVEELTLPDRSLKGGIYKYHCASLINSYLCDLETYLKNQIALHSIKCI